MAKKFGVNIDLQKNELQNGVIHKLASAPGSPVEGQTYYDTTLKQERFYNGTDWQNKGLADSGVAFIVKTKTSVSMTTTGNHLIYTVPAGKVFTAQRIIIRLQTISGTGSVPKISVGSNATTYDDIIENTTISGLTNTQFGFSISVEGTFKITQSGEGIYLKINNSSTYTTYVANIDLIGYEL